MARITDFKIGTASHPERLRFKGDPRQIRRLMAEKLQIDPDEIARELRPDTPSPGRSRVYKIKRRRR